MNEFIFWNDIYIYFCEIILEFGVDSLMKSYINEYIMDFLLLI